MIFESFYFFEALIFGFTSFFHLFFFLGVGEKNGVRCSGIRGCSKRFEPKCDFIQMARDDFLIRNFVEKIR